MLGHSKCLLHLPKLMVSGNHIRMRQWIIGVREIALETIEAGTRP